MQYHCSIYRTYWKPKATGAEIVRMSHIFIVIWAIWMGCWAVILNKAGVDLGWVCHICIYLPHILYSCSNHLLRSFSTFRASFSPPLLFLSASP